MKNTSQGGLGGVAMNTPHKCTGWWVGLGREALQGKFFVWLFHHAPAFIEWKVSKLLRSMRATAPKCPSIWKAIDEQRISVREHCRAKRGRGRTQRGRNGRREPWRTKLCERQASAAKSARHPTNVGAIAPSPRERRNAPADKQALRSRTPLSRSPCHRAGARP